MEQDSKYSLAFNAIVYYLENSLSSSSSSSTLCFSCWFCSSLLQFWHRFYCQGPSSSPTIFYRVYWVLFSLSTKWWGRPLVRWKLKELLCQRGWIGERVVIIGGKTMLRSCSLMDRTGLLLKEGLSEKKNETKTKQKRNN